MSPSIREKNIRIFERIVADATKPASLRRSATLRLARLKAAARPPATTRTPPPAAPAKPIPTAQARFEAVQSFHDLSRHRTALHRKRRTPAEQNIYASMICLMPATAPTTDDPASWSDFIGRISGILEEIKTTKPL
jgi:hypothetical protein